MLVCFQDETAFLGRERRPYILRHSVCFGAGGVRHAKLDRLRLQVKIERAVDSVLRNEFNSAISTTGKLPVQKLFPFFLWKI